MGKVGTDNQGGDAKNAAVRSNQSNHRYFGLVYASIDHQNKRVNLRLKRLGDRRHDLGKGHQRWCLDALADLREAGYIFETPEAVPGG